MGRDGDYRTEVSSKKKKRELFITDIHKGAYKYERKGDQTDQWKK